jgi:hypothetical protein
MIDVVVRILFIGNSLTAANDLPAMVEAMSAAAGARVEWQAVAKPDFSLEDHWNDGEARRAIARGGWTFVVLQQGPSARPESQVLLTDDVRRFNGLIRAAGAKTAVYMVWPSRARGGDLPRVIESYSAAARSVDALLLPAGEAWQDAWRRDPQCALYGPDGFHPSRLGSTLAALVIAETLTRRAVPASALSTLTPRDRATLRAAASAVRRPSSRTLR